MVPEPARDAASPWRNPMVWLMVGLPLSAVVAGFVTLWLAARDPDPLIDANLRRENLTWKAAPAPPTAPAPTTDAEP